MSPRTAPLSARPERLSFRFAREGERLAVELRTRGRGASCFLVFWLIGWTVGCVFLAGLVIRDPNVFHILFALPFWASWVFVFCQILYTTFGREYFMLDRRGAAHGRKVFVQISQRYVPLDEVKHFQVYRSSVTENDQPIFGIEMTTLGKTLHMARGLESNERNWLIGQFNDHLASLQAASAPLVADRSTPDDESAWTHEDENGETMPARPKHKSARGRRVLTLADQAVEPPSDCRWRREDAFSEIVFSWRGKFHPLAFGGALFITLFWNGIVSVFVCGLLGIGQAPVPPGMMWWGLFVFLIPFEAIGAVIFLGLLAVLAEPFHVRRWTIGRSHVEARSTWFGVGPGRNWLVVSLDRLEVLPGPGSRLTRFNLFGKSDELASMGDFSDNTRGSFKLSLVDHDNNELCALGNLTEGEARWIGDTILRERPRWFGD
ncbi:MAG: hypothetical protein JW818_00210 [Pirellulales bacterium]|nr:hypothetical protein [Pirellulales bacterium]